MHLRFRLRRLDELTSKEDEIQHDRRGDDRREFRLKCTRRLAKALCYV